MTCLQEHLLGPEHRVLVRSSASGGGSFIVIVSYVGLAWSAARWNGSGDRGSFALVLRVLGNSHLLVWCLPVSGESPPPSLLLLWRLLSLMGRVSRRGNSELLCGTDWAPCPGWAPALQLPLWLLCGCSLPEPPFSSRPEIPVPESPSCVSPLILKSKGMLKCVGRNQLGTVPGRAVRFMAYKFCQERWVRAGLGMQWANSHHLRKRKQKPLFLVTSFIQVRRLNFI